MIARYLSGGVPGAKRGRPTERDKSEFSRGQRRSQRPDRPLQRSPSSTSKIHASQPKALVDQ
jgi:hypothetical protein